MSLFKKHGERRTVSRFAANEFDPGTYYAAIRSSICTGEKVAGFRNRKTGVFTEVMLIRSQKDLEAFKEKYRVDTLKTEY